MAKTWCASSAVILRVRDYGDKDRIVTFITPAYGLVKGFARAARASRRRFGGALEPCAQVHLQWQLRPQSDLVELQEATIEDLHLGLRRDLAALALGAYGCEVTEQLFPEGLSQQGGFEILASYLEAVAQGPAAPQLRLMFALRALKLSGHQPHLLHCSQCGGPLKQGWAFFSPAAGGSLCCQCGHEGMWRISCGTLASLAALGRLPWQRYSGISLGCTTLAQGGPLLDACLGSLLPRRLHSSDLLTAYCPWPQA